MPAPNGLEFASKTDVGLVRVRNEDAIATEPECGFTVLADGMGGYNAGDIASRIATQVISEVLKDGLDAISNKGATTGSRLQSSLRQLLITAFQQANAAIFDASRNDPRCTGMGTTLVAAIFLHDIVCIAHVGDSRAYRFRDGTLAQLTRDHSLVQGQIDAGLINQQEALNSPHRNLVTRAVGIVSEVEVEVHEFTTETGDIYLLCSDGLSDMLLSHQLVEVLNSAVEGLDGLCENLVKAANDKGGVDNISVVLVKLTLPESARPLHVGRVLREKCG